MTFSYLTLFQNSMVSQLRWKHCRNGKTCHNYAVTNNGPHISTIHTETQTETLAELTREVKKGCEKKTLKYSSGSGSQACHWNIFFLTWSKYVRKSERCFGAACVLLSLSLILSFCQFSLPSSVPPYLSPSPSLSPSLLLSVTACV